MPTSSTHKDLLPSFLTDSYEECSRSLKDLYEVPDRLKNLTFFCLFADSEQMNFQEVVQDKKWRNVMDEEVKGSEDEVKDDEVNGNVVIAFVDISNKNLVCRKLLYYINLMWCPSKSFLFQI